MTPQSGTSQLEADDAPRIGVHVLSQFVFCPRAGLIAFRQQGDDAGEELSGIQRLDFMPQYDLAKIEAALQTAFQSFWWCFGGAVATTTFTAISMMWWQRQWLLPMVIVLAIIGSRLVKRIREVLILVNRRSAALAAKPNVPPLPLESEIAINWWEFRQAGFVPYRYEVALHDEDLHLAGKPWAVLNHGDLRIPVIRRHSQERTVFPQHILRLAAYCHLLEREIGATCPYGIVLWGYSYDGVAIPITSNERSVLLTKLEEVRELLAASLPHDDPLPPPASHCKLCPLGLPQVYQSGKSEFTALGDRLPVVGMRGNDRRTYHSCCGDHFRWMPPHEKAYALRLRS